MIIPRIFTEITNTTHQRIALNLQFLFSRSDSHKIYKIFSEATRIIYIKYLGILYVLAYLQRIRPPNDTQDTFIAALLIVFNSYRRRNIAQSVWIYICKLCGCQVEAFSSIRNIFIIPSDNAT